MILCFAWILSQKVSVSFLGILKRKKIVVVHVMSNAVHLRHYRLTRKVNSISKENEIKVQKMCLNIILNH